MDLLTRLLAAHADTPEDQRGDALRALLAEAGDLPGLRDAVISRFEELHGAEDGPDEDALIEMEALADIAEATSQQITDNAAREAALEERRTGAADRLARARQASEPAAPEDPGQGQGDGGAAAGASAENDDAETGAGQDDTGQGRPGQEGGQQPPATPTPDPAPGATPDAATGQQETAETTAETAARQPVAAAGGAGGTGGGGGNLPVPQARPTPLTAFGNRLPEGMTHEGDRDVIDFETYAAADIPGIPTGAPLGDIAAVADAMVARMTGLARLGKGRSAQTGIATIRRVAPRRLTFETENDHQVVDYACNERRLPGGSLVAAAGGNPVPSLGDRGWCAPSETLYNLCPTAAVDGMVDLPEVVTRRGGVRYANPPSFSELYMGRKPAPDGDPQDQKDIKLRGFHLTEGDVVAKEQKYCWEIPCQGMIDVRLDVDGLCIKTPLLTEKGWPELVQYFLQQALAAHAHRLNAWKLAKMTLLVNSKNNITIPAPDWTADETATASAPVPSAYGAKDVFGPGATATFLGAIELWAQQIRYMYRLAENTTLEMVAPRWLKMVFRADLSKRQGLDLFAVTDQQVESWLALRGVRVQWVVDWQDAYAPSAGPTDSPDTPTVHGAPTGVGLGGLPEKLTPPWVNGASVLLYPAGTYFAMTADVITIDGLYDSQDLMSNIYTKLFTEEGIQIAKRCYEPFLLNFQLCPNGITGGGVQRFCGNPPDYKPKPPQGTSGGDQQPALTGAQTTAGDSGSGTGSGKSKK